jgi:hypothetical protein
MFEIQHYTLCDGWINCWSYEDDDGETIPTTYDTFEEAQQELSDFLNDSEYEYQIGNIDTRYDASEYRIVQIEEVLA